MDSDYEELGDSLRRIIGMDYDYVQAKDPHRHFDPISAAAAYAVTIFVAFISGAATKMGEKTGKTLFEQISHLLGKHADQGEQQDLSHHKLREADESLSLLNRELSDDYLKSFLEAGKDTIERRLKADNFPERKAKRISSDFARLIEKRLKDGNAR
jgi:hypothetical protein